MTGKVKEGLAVLCGAAALALIGVATTGVVRDVLLAAALVAAVLALIAVAVALVRD